MTTKGGKMTTKDTECLQRHKKQQVVAQNDSKKM